MLPPSPLEWLPENHLAYFVLDVVDGVELSAIEISIQSKDPRGERPYSPRMMIALLARRKSIVEPALGQIKGARGFRRFSLRSFFKVRAEGTLVCLTHNLLKLYRSKLATVASV